MTAESTRTPTITHKQFYLEWPLYKRVEFSPGHESSVENTKIAIDGIERFKNPPADIDSYCVQCNKESSFKLFRTAQIIKAPQGLHPMRLSNPANSTKTDKELYEYFGISMECKLNSSHKMYALFLLDLTSILKIGQWPSSSDLKGGNEKKYQRLLGSKKYSELKSATRLFSGGVGIGSFVYLRRIFEGLVFDAYERVPIARDAIFRQQFEIARMDERIDMLREYLPEFLTANKKVYAILSKGIHELSDDECLRYFEVLYCGIEAILDEIIEKEERENKAKKAEYALGKIRGTLKNSSKPK